MQRVLVGLFFTGVKLSNDVCGVSYAPLKALSVGRLLSVANRGNAKFRQHLRQKRKNAFKGLISGSPFKSP
nr:hypothetical protein [uncultured Campylobacter sp.]